MGTQTLALLVEQDHNEVDCCQVHLGIFADAVALIGAGHGWAPVNVLN